MSLDMRSQGKGNGETLRARGLGREWASLEAWKQEGAHQSLEQLPPHPWWWRSIGLGRGSFLEELGHS